VEDFIVIRSKGWYVVAVLGALFAAGLPVPAEARPPRAARAVQEKTAPDVKGLAARIDRLIEAGWQKHKAKPAAPAPDAMFLRRVYLDLTGRVPPITEVRDFLDDDSSDKRAELVKRLLESDDHARHFAATWRRLLLPPDMQNVFGNTDLTTWLQTQFHGNVGYDRIARDILTAATGFGRFGPSSFYQANNYKPENLAASVSRIFLGVRLECAQCHDHPFAKWKRTEFWEVAAFFSDVAAPNTPPGAEPGARGKPSNSGAG
jgi:hypothetical protein